MKKWKNIWESKGCYPTTDLRWLDGYEKTKVDPEKVANSIKHKLQIQPNDEVLEVGCGAGMLAQFIAPCCRYTGVDYSKSLIDKHKEILDNQVYVAEANELPFGSKEFDKSFAYSVFHYFPDKKYAEKAIKELKRVTKELIFIGDIPTNSGTPEHLLYTLDDFEEGSIYSATDVSYPDRFNVLIRLCLPL